MTPLHSMPPTLRSTSTLAGIVSIAVLSLATATGAAGAPAPQPTVEATPAFMFLDVPASGTRAASEWPILSFSYDAEVGVPLHRRDPTLADDANVRVTMLFAKTDVAIPLTAKSTFATFVLIETDGAKAPIKRLTFHGVTIETIGPAGDEPSVRVTFVSRTVTTT